MTSTLQEEQASSSNAVYHHHQTFESSPLLASDVADDVAPFDAQGNNNNDDNNNDGFEKQPQQQNNDDETTWEQRFAHLAAYSVENGHCNVAKDEDEDLFYWIHTQRDQKWARIDVRAQHRKDRLDSIGFEWSTESRKKTNNDARWKQSFDQLVAYYNQHGHCDIPPSENLPLYSWGMRQRHLRESGALTKDRKLQLDSIGFQWNRSPTRQKHLDARWKERFDELAAYFDKNGHCNVGRRENKPLHFWINAQRRQANCTEGIDQDRRRQLDSIGFSWERNQKTQLDVRWQEKFDQLAAYYKQHGHSRIRRKENDSLFEWANRQRNLEDSGRILTDRKRQLDSIRFEWNTSGLAYKEKLDLKWKLRFDELVAYREENGHCNVTRKENKTLYEFARRQRRYPKRLGEAQKAKLNSIGFEWELVGIGINRDKQTKEKQNPKWKQRFDELVAYREENGHCNVTRKESKTLYEFVRRQRRNSKRLGEGHKAKLDSIGFEWNDRDKQTKKAAVDAKWKQWFDQLSAYQKQYGTCNVSPSVNLPLYGWKSRQRQLQETGCLDEDRKRQLDSIGFEWKKPHEETMPDDADVWEERFDELAAYYDKNGHCNVTRIENEKLYEWHCVQRKLNPNNLYEGRKRKLESIGFEWEEDSEKKGRLDDDEDWKDGFVQLVAYQEKNGHSNVTRREDEALYEWTNQQRYLQEKNTLDEHRRSQLDLIGFEWRHTTNRSPISSEETGWKHKLSQLKQFRNVHGHCNVTDEEDEPLSRWVSLQRSLLREGRLSEHEKEQLESIDGFCFVPAAKGTSDNDCDEPVVDKEDDESRYVDYRHDNTDAPDNDSIDREDGVVITERKRSAPTHMLAETARQKKRRTSHGNDNEQDNQKLLPEAASTSDASASAPGLKEPPLLADDEVIYGARHTVRLGTMVAVPGTPKQYEFRYEDGTKEILNEKEAQEAHELGKSVKESYIKKRVAKMIDGDPFAGWVVSFRDVNNTTYWKVKFDDGRFEEELDLVELKKYIAFCESIRMIGK